MDHTMLPPRASLFARCRAYHRLLHSFPTRRSSDLKVMPSPADEEAMAQQGGWGSTTMKLIGSGRLAMAVGGRWWLCTLRRYDKLRLGAVEAPHGPLRRFWRYGKSTMINKNSPHRDEALQ